MALQFNGGREPGRNELCPCGSGLKYKKCHGDALKREICNKVANEKMVELIEQEQQKKIVELYKQKTKKETKHEPTGSV